MSYVAGFLMGILGAMIIVIIALLWIPIGGG